MIVPVLADLYAVHRCDGKLRASRIIAFDEEGDAWVAAHRRVLPIDEYVVVHVDQLPPWLRPTSLTEEALEKLLASKEAA